MVIDLCNSFQRIVGESPNTLTLSRNLYKRLCDECEYEGQTQLVRTFFGMSVVVPEYTDRLTLVEVSYEEDART